jgi:ABC-type nitrate/sulfonate/bicarbonate transport system substrate-binding protein
MRSLATVLGAGLSLLLITGSSADAQTKSGKSATKPVATINVGFNSALDQIAVPVGVELGFFEDRGLEAKLAPAFASGVEALNALQAGNVDFVHVGAPLQGAMISGMDVVYIGGYTGTAVRIRSDEAFELVARQGSGIDPKDLTTFKGKKIASTLGSTNHLYVRNLLFSKGLKAEDFTLINTPPPEMSVAMKTGGVDAMVCWDPWPVITRRDNPGSYTVTRGGGYVANVGYMVARRDYAEKNPDIIERFLAARAEADQWVRKNPNEAAEIATRWIPGTNVDVAKESMQFVTKMLDGRVSGCTVLGMQDGMDFTVEMRKLPQSVDVTKHVRAAASLKVEQNYPQFFADLPKIPDGAKLPGDDLSKWDKEAAKKACPL